MPAAAPGPTSSSTLMPRASPACRPAVFALPSPSGRARPAGAAGHDVALDEREEEAGHLEVGKEVEPDRTLGVDLGAHELNRAELRERHRPPFRRRLCDRRRDGQARPCATRRHDVALRLVQRQRLPRGGLRRGALEHRGEIEPRVGVDRRGGPLRSASATASRASAAAASARPSAASSRARTPRHMAWVGTSSSAVVAAAIARSAPPPPAGPAPAPPARAWPRSWR